MPLRRIEVDADDIALFADHRVHASHSAPIMSSFAQPFCSGALSWYPLNSVSNVIPRAGSTRLCCFFRGRSRGAPSHSERKIRGLLCATLRCVELRAECAQHPNCPKKLLTLARYPPFVYTLWIYISLRAIWDDANRAVTGRDRSLRERMNSVTASDCVRRLFSFSSIILDSIIDNVL